MMHEPAPREIAIGDQHYAKLNQELDGLVAAYAEDPDAYLDRLDGFADEFANGDHFTNEDLQVQTLAGLLAAAIHRLATKLLDIANEEVE